MSFSSYLSERLHWIEKTLDQLVPEKMDQPHNSLYQAARYSLLGKGKRLRPLLAIATAESLGATLSICLQPACALELIHTYSLIHDDLPSLDNDDLRRGRPTLHKVVGEGPAILTGDFLLTHAFEMITTSEGILADQKVQLIYILANRAGGEGMVGGQYVDIITEGTQLDWKTLSFIHRLKTACLISAALEFGGILAGASDTDQHLLKEIGIASGLCFQIVDDVLDEIGDPKLLGKPILSDKNKEKCTAATLLGIPQAQDLAEKLLTSALQKCKSLSKPSPYLESLLQNLLLRSS
ncbi:MAG: polyprenyl synthetase family protein [Chlamydiae bacterium]|nr:polyprenyl synthetase family protein [Chlamydiota bacterium]